MKKICSMIPIMKKIAPVLLTAVFLLPLAARAEIKAGSVEVSPFAGYYFFDKAQNLKSSPVIGGRVGYNFTNQFGLEGTLEFIKSSVDDKSVTATQEGQFTSPIDKVRLTSYNLDLVYHLLPEGKFNPFLVAGYGASHYDPKINNKNMSVVNFGVGAKYWLADNIALRVDLRDNLVLDETINNIEATVGVVFAFGGKAATAPRQEARIVPAAAPAATPVAEEKVIIFASEPKVEEKVQSAKAAPKVVVLAFEDIHFDFDQSTLKPETKAILKRDIKLLKENPKAKIRVAGYTSAAGTEDYNQKLSERRAKAVQEYLISEGVVTPERLSTIGYGETDPAAYEAAPKELYSEAAKSNMRVLFEIVVQ